MASSPADFPFHVVEEEGRAVVRFPENTALSGANAEELAQGLAALTAGRDRPHLVVDLGSVTMLTSVILAKFIALNGRVRAAGGRLTLFNPSPTIHQVFKVTRLDTILDVKALSA
jgi:anti-anti-sigma factor